MTKYEVKKPEFRSKVHCLLKKTGEYFFLCKGGVIPSTPMYCEDLRESGCLGKGLSTIHRYRNLLSSSSRYRLRHHPYRGDLKSSS